MAAAARQRRPDLLTPKVVPGTCPIRAAAAMNDAVPPAAEDDAGSGEMIGDFPQAFSHIGLIHAAWAIAPARQRDGGPGPAASVASAGAQRYRS